MSGAVSPLPQYAFMAWCSGGAQGQLYLYQRYEGVLGSGDVAPHILDLSNRWR
jgi:hypothetical protein